MIRARCKLARAMRARAKGAGLEGAGMLMFDFLEVLQKSQHHMSQKVTNPTRKWKSCEEPPISALLRPNLRTGFERVFVRKSIERLPPHSRDHTTSLGQLGE